MAKTFTFKTTPSSGSYGSFYPDLHEIKIGKDVVGSIDDKFPHQASFKIVKSDITEDNSSNCIWKRMTLKHKAKSVKEQKEWLKKNFKDITEYCPIYRESQTTN